MLLEYKMHRPETIVIPKTRVSKKDKDIPKESESDDTDCEK